MGPQQLSDVRDCWPHVQCCGLLRNHEHGVETPQWPWQELETRVQGWCIYLGLTMLRNILDNMFVSGHSIMISLLFLVSSCFLFDFFSFIIQSSTFKQHVALVYDIMVILCPKLVMQPLTLIRLSNMFIIELFWFYFHRLWRLWNIWSRPVQNALLSNAGKIYTQSKP